MVEIREHVDITHTTFKLPATARYFAVAESIDDIIYLYTQAKEVLKISLYILGSGSNTLFANETIPYLVIAIKIKGFYVVSEDATSTTIEIGAGEDWDEVVAKTVAMNLSGIEAMSAIPGTVGATPVQNVGAYGQEIRDTLVSVICFDTHNGELTLLDNSECGFGYRDSIFKTKEKGRYIILSVTLRLSKNTPMVPNYPGVMTYFQEKSIVEPTLQQIRDAIIEIRRLKLPDPKLIKNCGSFFKNPIVEKGIADELQKNYPTLKVFPVDDTKTKIPAGWLIEQCGLKGAMIGPIEVYPHNALVLVNKSNATIADLQTAIKTVVDAVYQKFGIVLEVEPNIVE
jgi:UDP-N-acetylmuramate dehydrogenase